MEFIVAGVPRSANANPRSRRRWRERVSRAARDRLQEEPIDQDIGILIIYFYHGETSLDVDNIAKSLLDGLKGVLFRDDQQVSELRVRKSHLSTGLSLIGASLYLLETIERMSQAGSDFVY